MNIKHNRYVIFLGPLIWVLVAMSTPRTVQAGIFTLWFVMTGVYDICEISHEKIYKYSPDQIGKWRDYTLIESTMTCWFAAMGYPGLSVLGILFIKLLQNPVRLATMLGMLWSIYYGLGFMVDWKWIIGAYPRWYGVLLMLWALMRHSMKLEISSLGKGFATKQYTVIWAMRFTEQFILSTLRWFTWCDCVFPYVPRWDIYFYGVFLTILAMWLVNHKRPQKILEFEEGLPPGHMPAPCPETAAKCNICRERQKAIDIEQGGDNRGWTFFENAPNHKIL